jgi:4'-phosphopantetheinyl transferase
MPLEKIHTENDRVWGLWHIEESEDELLSLANLTETIPSTLTNPNKRLEHIAARALVKSLMSAINASYRGIRKDEFGKPFPEGSDFQLSLSHSYPYVAALLDRNSSAGIDLEQFKIKLLKIAPRVLSIGELENAGRDLKKHCVYWCAKEALIKIYGKKGLVLAQNLKIEPFELRNEGFISGKIIVNGTETKVPLYYQVNDEFAVVLNK